MIDYATLEQFKEMLKIAEDDTSEDTDFERALTTASRGIDKWCHRSFNHDTVATARVYQPLSSKVAIVDDFWTVEGLVIATGEGDDTFGTTWATADRQLYPLNGIVDGVAGWPFWKLKARGGAFFPAGSVGEVTLQVTAKWGWADVPVPVHQACLLLAQETDKLEAAPFGVAGYGVDGVVMRVQNSPKISGMLKPYQIDAVLVA